MNKKVTLKDIAIMQSGIYMKTDSQGEVRYLQVKDVNSENKLDYTQIATVINTGINDKHWLKKIGRASCRKECRSRWSPYH